MSGATVELEHRAEDDGNSPVGFRSYNTKKTLAEGLLDIGLLVANATQFKTLLSVVPAAEYYYPNLVLISLSVTLQVDDFAVFGFNSYAQKKTLTKGLLDIGLLMANATQFKSVLSLGPDAEYYYPNLVLISLYIRLQIMTLILIGMFFSYHTSLIVTGVMLLVLGKWKAVK